MTIKKILVPTDFSRHARAAIDQAHELAQAFGAKIDLVHVWELPPLGAPEWMVSLADQPPMAARDFIRLQAAQQMEALTAELREQGMNVDGRLEEGNAGRVIVELAAKEKYDLVVMSTHGRTGVERFFIGSVAENVVRRSPCPVLVVRPEVAAAPRR